MQNINHTKTEDRTAVDITTTSTLNLAEVPPLAPSTEGGGFSGGDGETPGVVAIPLDGGQEAFFARVGLTRERLAAVEAEKAASPKAKKNHRQDHIDAISENYKQIIADHNGTSMLAATTVLTWLLAHGFGLTAHGRQIQGANCIGDSLGNHGLRLPSIIVGGKRRYALEFVNATPQEKAEAQKHLNLLTNAQLRALPYA